MCTVHRDHGCHRGGVHACPPVHQQDQVRGEVHGEALPAPGQPPGRVPAQDGGDGQGAVLLPPPCRTGGMQVNVTA